MSLNWSEIVTEYKSGNAVYSGIITSSNVLVKIGSEVALNENVPAGKKWTVNVSVGVKEEDA